MVYKAHYVSHIYYGHYGIPTDRIQKTALDIAILGFRLL